MKNRAVNKTLKRKFSCCLSSLAALVFTIALIPMLISAPQVLANSVENSPLKPELQQHQLQQQAMNSQLSQQQRIAAIRQLYADQLEQGEIPLRKICVWDVLGRNGPTYAAAVDQQARMGSLGVNLDIQAYTSENVLAQDLKAGQCDAALFTGIRAREFNQFTGTLDAIGAIPDREHMQVLMKVLSHSRNAPRMEQGQFVVMGFAPMGSAYVFVNDKAISSLPKAAGKKVAVLDSEPIQAEMVLKLGANPVPTSIVSAGGKFNNGAVDVLPAPLVAYHMLELHRGIGEHGGIIQYPFSLLTLQLVGRLDKFPREIAQLVREDFFKRFGEIEQQVNKLTGDINPDLWIEISAQEKAEYQKMMQQARIDLREQGYYHSDMLRLQRKVRCKFSPAHPECALALE